jgi:hypothetical protein
MRSAIQAQLLVLFQFTIPIPLSPVLLFFTCQFRIADDPIIVGETSRDGSKYIVYAILKMQHSGVHRKGSDKASDTSSRQRMY